MGQDDWPLVLNHLNRHAAWNVLRQVRHLCCVTTGAHADRHYLPGPDKAGAPTHNNPDTAIIPNLVSQQAGCGVDGSIADDALVDLCDVSVMEL